MSNSAEKQPMGADMDDSEFQKQKECSEKPLTGSGLDDDSKVQKQKECLENCTLLYQFASNDLHKFAILQQVFGACNVVRLVQDLPSDQRVEAIDSLVFEASARLENPAFGCTDIIHQLQRQVSDLQSQITTTQTTIQKIRSQQAVLLASLAGFNAAGEDGNKFKPTTSASPKDDDDQDED